MIVKVLQTLVTLNQDPLLLVAKDQSKSGSRLNTDVHTPPREIAYRTTSQQSFCHSQMTYVSDSDHGTENDSSQTVEQNQSTFSNVMSKSNVTQVSIPMYLRAEILLKRNFLAPLI